MEDQHQTATSISEAAGLCLQSLQRCVSHPQLMHHEWAENRLAEFKLWADGVGAFASDRASLDMRLAMELETHSLILNLLILLGGCIEACKTAGATIRDFHYGEEFVDQPGTDDEPAQEGPGSSSAVLVLQGDLEPPADPIPRAFSPWSDLSSTSDDSDDMHPAETVDVTLPELDTAQGEVDQIIDHLARLGVAIRKSGASTRSQKADRLFREEDHWELFRHLTVVVLGRGTMNGSQDQAISPAFLSPIQKRLIRANLRRRNRFLYAQRHARKLALSALVASSYQVAPPVFDSPAFPEGPIVREPALPEISEPEETPEIDNPVVPPPVHYTTPFSATSASAVKTAIEEVARQVPRQSQLAQTTITSTAAKVVYPRPPPLRDGVRQFKCPCCCQTLPDLYHERSHWKKHLMADISPYTCIIDDCPHPDLLHGSRRAWMQHVEKDHPRCLECLPCKTPDGVPLLFSSVEEFLAHTRAAHADSIKEDQYSTLVAAASRTAPSGISQCPLCNESGTADSDALLDHIAEHVHSFSLYSLPWPKDERFDDNDGSEDDPDDYFRDQDYFGFDQGAGSNYPTISVGSEQDMSGMASLPSSSDSVRARSVVDEQEGVDEVQNDRASETGSSGVSSVSSSAPHYGIESMILDSFKVATSGPEVCVGQILRNGILVPRALRDEPSIPTSWDPWKPSADWSSGYMRFRQQHPTEYVPVLPDDRPAYQPGMPPEPKREDKGLRSRAKQVLSRTRDALSRTKHGLLGTKSEHLEEETMPTRLDMRPLWARPDRLWIDSYKEVVSGPEICSGFVLRYGSLVPEGGEDPGVRIWSKWEPWMTWRTAVLLKSDDYDF